MFSAQSIQYIELWWTYHKFSVGRGIVRLHICVNVEDWWIYGGMWGNEIYYWSVLLFIDA
jgi:hypothetical protein